MNNIVTEPQHKQRSFLWRSLPYFVFAHAAHHFLMALQQPLFPTIRDYFKIGTYFEAGTIPLAFALAAATGQVPAGWFADRFGPIPLIMIGTLGVAVAGVLVGLSTNFIMLIVTLILMGLLSGGYHPAATPLISASVPLELRGRALGLHLVGGNAAFFISPIVAAAIFGVFGEESGWRYSFLVMAVPTVLFGLVFYFFYLKRQGGTAHVSSVKRQIVEEKPPQPGYKRRLIAF